ncbi:Clp protease N-terminal domain-containing protein [Actinoplanes sp. NPDC051343]|uniref:Clp protease N-terminal domain-containing protein n=1 Tax=Actinoplanes sp. NPDC051343 TaxID=3363906 RepID=UPI00379971CC
MRGDIIRRVGPHPPDLSAAAAEQEDAEALKAIGIDLDEVRKAIEANFGAGALRLPRDTEQQKKRGLFGRFYVAGGHIPFTRRNKKVLELSLREALQLDQKFIAPEHIMLGMLREGEGLAVQILHEKGVDFTRLRADMTTALRARAA